MISRLLVVFAIFLQFLKDFFLYKLQLITTLHETFKNTRPIIPRSFFAVSTGFAPPKIAELADAGAGSTGAVRFCNCNLGLSFGVSEIQYIYFLIIYLDNNL